MLKCLSNIVKCFFAIHQPQSKQSAVNHQAERGTTAHLIQNADGRLPTRSIPIMPRLSGRLVNHVMNFATSLSRLQVVTRKLARSRSQKHIIHLQPGGGGQIRRRCILIKDKEWVGAWNGTIRYLMVP